MTSSHPLRGKKRKGMKKGRKTFEEWAQRAPSTTSCPISTVSQKEQQELERRTAERHEIDKQYLNLKVVVSVNTIRRWNLYYFIVRRTKKYKLHILWDGRQYSLNTLKQICGGQSKYADVKLPLYQMGIIFLALPTPEEMQMINPNFLSLSCPYGLWCPSTWTQQFYGLCIIMNELFKNQQKVRLRFPLIDSILRLENMGMKNISALFKGPCYIKILVNLLYLCNIKVEHLPYMPPEVWVRICTIAIGI